jgi:hypothetical protein
LTGLDWCIRMVACKLAVKALRGWALAYTCPMMKPGRDRSRYSLTQQGRA